MYVVVVVVVPPPRPTISQPSPQGILSPQDAVAAVEAGADGVIVSNHGGRALDGALSSIESLGPVVKVCVCMYLCVCLWRFDAVFVGLD